MCIPDRAFRICIRLLERFYGRPTLFVPYRYGIASARQRKGCRHRFHENPKPIHFSLPIFIAWHLLECARFQHPGGALHVVCTVLLPATPLTYFNAKTSFFYQCSWKELHVTNAGFFYGGFALVQYPHPAGHFRQLPVIIHSGASCLVHGTGSKHRWLRSSASAFA